MADFDKQIDKQIGEWDKQSKAILKAGQGEKKQTQDINFQERLKAMKAEEEKLLQMKPEVRINGQLYRLRFDLYAFEQVEEQFGGFREAFSSMSGNKILPNVKKLFAILANSQRNMDGLPEDVTGEEITKHEPVSKLLEISQAIKAAMVQGMVAETADGGPASDKKKNPIKEEHEAKNG